MLGTLLALATCAPVPVPADVSAFRAALYAPGHRGTMPPAPEAVKDYSAAIAEARKTDWADLCRYEADNSRLRKLPRVERTVVFIGDSITQYWSLGDPGFFRRGWINRGIGGQTSPQMLVRFSADVVSLRPKVVHIMAGTNDLAGNTGPTSLDAIETNIAAMITLAKAAKIQVVLAATPPSAKFGWAPKVDPAILIIALNKRLAALAKRENVVFVDYGIVLSTPSGALRPELTFDGTHPDAAGYAAMRAKAEASIRLAMRGAR